MANKKKTILIIEDDLVLINALEKKLSKEGFNILVSRDGEDGLKKSL